MNYELAKQLKEAGWEFKLSLDPEMGIKFGPARSGAPTYSLPTLSELIEVCGEKFWLCDDRRGEEKKWHATSTRDQKHPAHGFGSTPEEAIAHLWLALNNPLK